MGNSQKQKWDNSLYCFNFFDPTGSYLESFRACGSAPQERRIALSTLWSGYPSACGDTLGREKERRGPALRSLLF